MKIIATIVAAVIQFAPVAAIAGYSASDPAAIANTRDEVRRLAERLAVREAEIERLERRAAILERRVDRIVSGLADVEAPKEAKPIRQFDSVDDETIAKAKDTEIKFLGPLDIERNQTIVVRAWTAAIGKNPACASAKNVAVVAAIGKGNEGAAKLAEAISAQIGDVLGRKGVSVERIDADEQSQRISIRCSH
jgi:hypothetical protein